jgi:hypothetical protein
LKKYKLLDEMNELDNKLLDRTINIDTEEKLNLAKKEEKKEFFKNNIKYLFAGCACTCAFIFGVIMLTRNGDKNIEILQEKDSVKIVNPINEVTSVDEIEKNIGLSVPLLEKEVDSYLVIDENDDKIGRILYSDSSVFSIGRKNKVSGMFGGTLTRIVVINNIKVELYDLDGIKYAEWNNGDIFYSYTASSEENIEKTIEKLVK